MERSGTQHPYDVSSPIVLIKEERSNYSIYGEGRSHYENDSQSRSYLLRSSKSSLKFKPEWLHFRKLNKYIEFMISNREMVNIFNEDNLVYAHPSTLHNIKVLDTTKEFVLNTGLPHVVSYFRFSMDFEPLSDDVQIGRFVEHFGQLFTIGCQGVTQLTGRMVKLSEIGLNNNSSLSDIGRTMKALKIDDAIFSSEVTQAPRICLDSGNYDQIVMVSPLSLSIQFFNSSVQQLASSIAAYERFFVLEKDFEVGLSGFNKELKNIDPKALEGQENVWVSVVEQLILEEEGY